MEIEFQEREKELFKNVIGLFKNQSSIQEIGQLLINSLNEINNSKSELTDADSLFKVKIILILGKFYLKLNYGLNELIQILEKELKINLHVSLVSLLYRCYYFKTIKEKEKEKDSINQTLMYSLHQRTVDLIDKVRKDNIQDISMSKYSFVQSNFKFTSTRDKIDYEFEFENDISCSICPTIQFKLPINLVSCGRYFIMALDSNGLVWNWGESYEAASNMQKTPSFPHPSEKTIKSIAAGFHHCLALADDGTVYGWGSNSFGCLNSMTRDGTYLRSMTPFKFNEKIIKIEAGGFNSAFISASGKLSVLGRNDRLQLGFNQIPSLFPNIQKLGSKVEFLPEISIPSSTVSQDFTPMIGNSQYSDIQVLFHSIDNDSSSPVESVYLHSVLFLSQLSNKNPTLVSNLKELKRESASDGKVVIDFKKLLEITATETQEDQEIIKCILNQAVEEQMNQFIDFISFIYTNSTSKRNSAPLANYFSKIFKCTPLFHFLTQENRYIPSQSQLNLSDNLYSFAYNNQESFPDCIVTNGEIELYCHQVVLSSRNSIAKEIISKSTPTKDGLLKISFPNDRITNSELVLIVSYLYSDRIKLVSIPSEEITGNFILSLYQASKSALSRNRFGVSLLKLISQSVTKDNAEQLLKWAQENAALPLIDYIDAFLGNRLAPQYIETGRDGLYKESCPFPNENVVNVAVGQKLMLVVTDDNKLYQLGIGSDRSKKHINLITLPNPKSKIIKISCGSSHCLVLTENFQVYGWGCGFEGQVVKNTRKIYKDPVLLFDAKYNNMKAGFYSSLFWNDHSTFPLNLTNNSDTVHTGNRDLVDKFDKLNITSNDQVQINIYNFENENRLWYFNQFKSFKENLVIKNNKSKPIIASITSKVENLPPLLVERYLENKNSSSSSSSSGNNEISLFGFSKESVEILLLLNQLETSDQDKSSIIQSIQSGDQLIDLLFLSTSLGSIKASEFIFQQLKSSLTLEDSLLLLSCIYTSNYSIQLSFLFNYLLGILNFKKLEILKNEQLLKLVPEKVMDVLLYININKQ